MKLCSAVYRPVPAANEVFRRLVSPFLNIIFLRALYLPYIFLLCKQNSFCIFLCIFRLFMAVIWRVRIMRLLSDERIADFVYVAKCEIKIVRPACMPGNDFKTALASASLFPCELAISSRLFSDKSIA